MDGFEKGIVAFFAILCIAAVILIGFLVRDAIRPTFALYKADWICTREHTYTAMVPIISGKTTILVPMVQTECDQWTRK